MTRPDLPKHTRKSLGIIIITTHGGFPRVNSDEAQKKGERSTGRYIYYSLTGAEILLHHTLYYNSIFLAIIYV